MTNLQSVQLARKDTLWGRIKKNHWVYVFIIPCLLHLIIFSYFPIYGITLAFKDYHFNKGIIGSPWADPLYKNFMSIKNDPLFWKAFWNTFRVGFFYILTSFPAPIILAIILNEVKHRYFKRTLQTVFTFPNFLSWVMVGGLMVNLFASQGIVNNVLALFGVPRSDFLANRDLVRPMLYLSNVWKGAGWGAIIYLAAIAGIPPEQYEAAVVDGANRWQKIWYITWPAIKATAVILLILDFGGILNNGFDQILNMTNPVVQQEVEVLDTYIYRRSFLTQPDYGFSTAMGLMKSVINFVFLVGANSISKRLGGGGVL